MTLANFALAGCMLLSMLSAAAAQDRMPPIPKDKMTEAQKKAADELAAGPRGAGSMAGPFVPLLRSPEYMSRLQKTGEYVRFQNSIGQKLTEFVILLTARQWTQQYEYDAHQPTALKAGVKQEFITAIADGRRPTIFVPNYGRTTASATPPTREPWANLANKV
jgi:4-carboxymuconolactone decarboxylase